MSRVISKRCELNKVIPNMKLAKDLLSYEGRPILREGVVLTNSLIRYLGSWGIKSLDVVVQETELMELDDSDVVFNESKFLQQYLSTIQTIKEVFDTVRYFKEVPLYKMKELADQSINLFIDTFGIINHLHVMRSVDDYTFRHSLHVAIISGILGKWMGYNGIELRELVLSGLLHDIGKAQVPLHILNKPGKLTADEMQFMRLHPTLGYELIAGSVPDHVAAGVYQHHERINGTGYPAALKGDLVSKTARIIAIADMYDAMTSDRIYRRAHTPFAAVEVLAQGMYAELDLTVCNTFLRNVRDYFVGNMVRLSDGRNAKVIALGTYAATRPMVYASDGEFIDLEQRKELSILELLQAEK